MGGRTAPLPESPRIQEEEKLVKMKPTPIIELFFYLLIYVIASFALADVSTDEVKIEVVVMPEVCEQKSKKGDLLNAHYDGFLASDGSQFYCSRSAAKGHPQWFVLGVGQVIKGLDVGLVAMCPGEKRKITVPPALAFGTQGKAPEIPPNATLIFEVELYAVTRGPRSMESFREMDLDQDRTLSQAEVKAYLKNEYKAQKDEAYIETVLKDIFLTSDKDKDGSITAKEYNVYNHDEL